MEQEIQDLKDLPLEALISAPLNAVIAAQANAALTTANFIQQIGFINTGDQSNSIFDQLDPTASSNPDKFAVRTAEVVFTKKEVVPPAAGSTTSSTRDIQERILLPFISLFNVPSIEISELAWDFSVKLKRMEVLNTDLTHSTSNTITATGSISTPTGGGTASLGPVSLPLPPGVPVAIGASLKVESTSKTNFDLRYGLGREHEYNMNISIKAIQGPTPPGIERLMAIAERIAAANEQATNA